MVQVVNNKIYKNILSTIDNTITNICKNHSSVSTTDVVKDQANDAIQILNDYRTYISDELQKLEKLAVWDVFTIAVYGETNAGKSTLIETLRILFKEKTKLEQINTFNAFAKNINFDDEALDRIEAEIQRAEQNEIQANSAFKALTSELDTEEAQTANELASLKQTIEIKKLSSSFFKKIIYLFKKLEEEKLLIIATEKANEQQIKFKQIINAELAVLQELQNNLADKKQAREKFLNELEKLNAFQDGEIIGNGRSDFTLLSKNYSFEINGQKFDLIDVPGIEGNEATVSDNIFDSVKKSHAVFYISPKAAPPNTGDGKIKGTLEKIKEHLGDQTEVWAIFNKRITNPIALRGTNLLSDDETAGLNDLHKQLKTQLGESFLGVKSISALPAFYASSQCILPTNPHFAARKKFQNSMSSEDLLNRSQLSDFCKFIEQDICKNFKLKIEQANRKKISVSVEQGNKAISNLKDKLKISSEGLQNQITSSKDELDKLVISIANQLVSNSSIIVEEAKTQMRQQIYAEIKTEIDNDYLEFILEQGTKKLSQSLQQKFETLTQEQQNSFIEEVEAVVHRVSSNISEIMNIQINQTSFNKSSKFNFQFKMDNGINILSIASGLAGAALLIWNPVGWALTVASVIGIVASLAKGLYGFFSKSYKQGQQRKATDKYISELFKVINDELNKNMSQTKEQLEAQIKAVKIEMNAPLETLLKILTVIETAEISFKKIEQQLS